MRFPTFFLASLGCLLLTSCFDIREEIWIERDGSGRAELQYVFPASALVLIGGEQGLRNEVRRLIDSEPDLHLDELSLTTTGSDTTILLKASTSSMLSLIDMQDNEVFRTIPDAASGFVGEFSVSLKGLSVDFKRHLDLQKTLGLASLAISGSQRQQRQLQYIIHLPTAARTHNATEAADSGHTLIWKYRLGEALSSPINTNFRTEIPIPWWLFAGALLIVALLIWALAKAWKRHRLRRLEI